MKKNRLVLKQDYLELRRIKACSIDSFITKRFGNKELKNAFLLKECMRVMKPGAYGLISVAPRTMHHYALALEQAGFETMDIVLTHPGYWLLIRKPIERETCIENMKKWGTGLLFGSLRFIPSQCELLGHLVSVITPPRGRVLNFPAGGKCLIGQAVIKGRYKFIGFEPDGRLYKAALKRLLKLVCKK